MDKELLSDIQNKLTAPKIALEKLTQGEKLPREYLELQRIKCGCDWIE